MICKLLIVGEAWGSEEERRSLARGKPSPFVGKAGWFLRTSLTIANILPPPLTTKYPGPLGMEREWDLAAQRGIWVTNAFQCRPSTDSNDIEGLLGDKRANSDHLLLTKPPLRPSLFLRKEHEHHLHRLSALIDELKPNLIILLGETALWALTDHTGVGKARGSIISLPPAPKILPTFHPTTIFRRWNLRVHFLADLLKASREMESSIFDRRDRQISHSPESPTELWDWWNANKTSQLLSVDIETEANRWVSEVGIAVSETKALHVPLLVRPVKGGPIYPYWKNPTDEARTWLFLKHVLEQPNQTPITIVGQNFLYDIQYLLRVAPVPGGIRVRGFRHDTMLEHHALYPGLEKSLGFMASVYCNEPYWKDIRQKGGKEEGEE